MKQFTKKNILERRKMDIKELSKYYFELRKYNYENKVSLRCIEIRKKIHFILLELIKIDRILSKENLSVVGDKRIKTKNAKIYACTHIGGNDVQRAFEAIKEHAYLFIGDPKELYRDLTGVILFLNGAICLETNNKIDRNIAYKRSIELLSTGTNLLIYPEGAWNISENLPVMQLYPGVSKMQLETGADIIPMAKEQYDNNFYVNIGSNILYNSINDNIDVSKQLLRDQLATLKWEIWEKYGRCRRNELTEEEKNDFQQNIVDKCPYDFTIQDVYDTLYKDKTIIEPDEAYVVSPKRQFELKKKYSNYS